MFNRELAEKYLNENVLNVNLKKHCYAVEKILGDYAVKLKVTNPDVDVEEWKLAGLLHDADWEKYPDKHPTVVVKWLMSMNASSNIINAIHSHGSVEWAKANGGNEIDGIDRFIPRKSLLDYYLFASDEISGLVIAIALMRPNKLDDLEVKSVMKKIKDKGFARGVSREDLVLGAKEINLPLEEHISNVIVSLRGIRDVLFS